MKTRIVFVCIKKLKNLNTLTNNSITSQILYPNDHLLFLFANCGIDFFGPFYFQEQKDKTTRVYGLILKCLVTGAAHQEVCPDFNTDTIFNNKLD